MMWLFTVYGFFSVSVPTIQDGATIVAVRARSMEHLVNLKKRFKALDPYSAEISLGTDYAYRMYVPQTLWAELTAELATEQTWSNFKGEVLARQSFSQYERVLHRVWTEMLTLQPFPAELRKEMSKKGKR